MKIESFNTSNLWKGFKDPAPVEEDPETQQAVLEDKDIRPDISPYNPYDTNASGIDTSDILSVGDELPSFNVTSPSIYRSYKHITLPEALIYIYILENPVHKLDHATLQLNKQNTTHILCSLDLTLFNLKKKSLAHFRIDFHVQHLKATIYEKDKKVGQVTYVIRGKKCEEIDGQFKHKKLILDPVWHTSKKGDLKEENFRFGRLSTTLIYQSNKKHSTRRTFMDTPKFNMSVTSTKKDKVRRWVTKMVSCQDTSMQTKLLFHQNVLIPIGGHWHIVK